MHYDSKHSKTQLYSGYKNDYSKHSKSQPDSCSSKEKTSSSETKQIKILNNYEICCVYKINTTNYYRNVYKKETNYLANFVFSC
jgi:hypothetical protein